MYDSVIPNQVSKLGSTSTDIEIRIIEGTDNVGKRVVAGSGEDKVGGYLSCYSQSGRECRVVTHSTLHQVGIPTVNHMFITGPHNTF